MTEKLVKAINKYEGDEYFDNGLSYLISFDKIYYKDNIQKSITEYLYSLADDKNKINLKSFQITGIINIEDDIKQLLTEWHINNEISKELLKFIKSNNVKIYKFEENDSYVLYESIFSVFRWINVEKDWYALEFYLSD